MKIVNPVMARGECAAPGQVTEDPRRDKRVGHRRGERMVTGNHDRGPAPGKK